MKVRLPMLCAVALLGSLALVQPAAAAGSSVKVTTTPKYVNICRSTPEQLRFNFEFSSKIKVRNTTKPKRVLVTYTVLDAATGAQITSGRVTLTPKNKYKKQSAAIFVAAGQATTYKLKAVYRAPNSGKSVTAKTTIGDQIPTAADMDAANAASPTAPPFPDCAALPAQG